VRLLETSDDDLIRKSSQRVLLENVRIGDEVVDDLLGRVGVGLSDLSGALEVLKVVLYGVRGVLARGVHRDVARSDLEADDEVFRKGEEGGVLSDEGEDGGFGAEEVVEEAGVGGFELETELFKSRANGGVVERTDYDSSVKVKLQEEKVSIIRGREGKKEEDVYLQPRSRLSFAVGINERREEIIDLLLLPVVPRDVKSSFYECRIGIRRASRCRGRSVEWTRPVEMRRVEEEVERCGLLPCEGDSAIAEDRVEEGGNHAEKTAEESVSQKEG
jgi:hypothetical protein